MNFKRLIKPKKLQNLIKTTSQEIKSFNERLYEKRKEIAYILIHAFVIYNIGYAPKTQPQELINEKNQTLKNVSGTSPPQNIPTDITSIKRKEISMTSIIVPYNEDVFKFKERRNSNQTIESLLSSTMTENILSDILKSETKKKEYTGPDRRKRNNIS